MQQPIAQQHDHMGSQQAISQPMVLCPVRFVYETQILVQPGDHIQPNQTFFINAQNPPPWMQNSLQARQAISSPVVYVQQLPNNIVSTVQQPIDQNQLYLQQNFANFQIQQQMLAQNQDMRQTMQIANIMPNMVQNMQSSVANDRSGHQNGQMQQNNQLMPVQMNRPVQNQMTQVEVQRQVMTRPQMHQQTNTPRPVMPMNQVQNMPQQALPVQNITQNTNHIMPMGRPSPNINIVRAPAPNNVVSVQPLPKIREISPSDVNKSVNSPLSNVVPSVRNFVPNYYRPIQPRPQTNQNVANIPKSQQHIPVQTVQTTPIYNHDRNNSQQTAVATNSNYAIIQQLNNPVNRKRKSESPDEIQKKMAVSTLKHNHQQSMTITKIVNEIGTNTSPVHKPRINTQFKPNNRINNFKNSDSIIENMIKEAIMPEKDKLIRNTVYTQARGRLLQDKIEEKPHIEIKNEHINMIENNVGEIIKMEINDEQKVTEVNKSVQTMESLVNINKNIVMETKQNSVKEEIKVVESKEKNQNTSNQQYGEIQKILEIKQDNVEENLKKTEEQHIQIVVNIKNPDIVPTENRIVEKDDAIKNSNDKSYDIKEEKTNNNNKEENNKTIQQDNINILTHVVDGYVIQESNVAFPIRKPLKEKTLHTNTKPEESEEKDLLRESLKEELKNNVDIPLLPFHYLMLDSAKEDKDKMDETKMTEDTTDDNPFAKLQHSTVKNWTVNDVCNHLHKYNWKETVSLFHDHEIDGESLLLVSKQQLITIGVKEDHADIICEFVKG